MSRKAIAFVFAVAALDIGGARLDWWDVEKLPWLGWVTLGTAVWVVIDAFLLPEPNDD